MPPAVSPALPLRITRMEACFVIRDAGKRALAYVYFENDATRANITATMAKLRPSPSRSGSPGRSAGRKAEGAINRRERRALRSQVRMDQARGAA